MLKNKIKYKSQRQINNIIVEEIDKINKRIDNLSETIKEGIKAIKNTCQK
jgi:hypothetical protein